MYLLRQITNDISRFAAHTYQETMTQKNPFFLHRWPSPRPQGHPDHPRVHPSLSKATYYDRQRRERGRTAVDTKLPDYYA